MISINVDLPEPDFPTIPVIFPFLILNDFFLKICFSSYLNEISFNCIKFVKFNFFKLDFVRLTSPYSNNSLQTIFKDGANDEKLIDELINLFNTGKDFTKIIDKNAKLEKIFSGLKPLYSSAGGFADFSRLASSDAKMWSDVFVANSSAVEKVLDDYIQSLLEFREVIRGRDRESLKESFKRAKQTRENFITQHFKPKKQVEMTSNQRIFTVQPGGSVTGSIRVAGDKSISHRSIILASIANGKTRVSGFLEGEDALNTVAAFREMGVTIVGPENGELTIYGVGKLGLQAPRKPLYMGNSGTAMRLLAGLLAAQSFDSVLTGDESLNLRPMNRIAEPLREMGAIIETGEGGTPPLAITGCGLNGISYVMPMASAQVKSCLLLAGLYAEGETRIFEPAPCRDHTERMLQGFG